MQVYRFVDGKPKVERIAKDDWEATDMCLHPERFGLEPGNYYMGRIMERHDMGLPA